MADSVIPTYTALAALRTFWRLPDSTMRRRTFKLYVVPSFPFNIYRQVRGSEVSSCTSNCEFWQTSRFPTIGEYQLRFSFSIATKRCRNMASSEYECYLHLTFITTKYSGRGNLFCNRHGCLSSSGLEIKSNLGSYMPVSCISLKFVSIRSCLKHCVSRPSGGLKN